VPLPRHRGVFFAERMLHCSGNNLTQRRRHAYVLHYGDAQSRWLADPKAKNPFLRVTGREYAGGL
jgi:hypothetical protein